MSSWQKILFINSPEIKEKYLLTDNDYRVVFFIFRKMRTHMCKFYFIDSLSLARMCKLSCFEVDLSSEKLLKRGLLIHKTKKDDSRCNYDIDKELKKELGALVKKHTVPTTEEIFRKKCGKMVRSFDPSLIKPKLTN